MEYGEMAVGVFVDPDPGLDVVVAVPVRGDLQDQPLVAHRVVIADDAVFLDTQDVCFRGGKQTLFTRRLNVR